jgi:peptide deformylase
MDENMKEHTIEADGLLARVLQHEIDHLNGIYFSDRLSSIRKTLIQSKLKKISRGDISPDYDIVLSNGELITFQEEK